MAKRKPKTQPKLFADSSVEVAYVLTNQNNLNYVLSNGWIVPREVYSKYYPDPSEHTLGFIPLMLVPPPDEFIQATIDESSTSFPVIIEINIADLQGEIPVVDTSGAVATVTNSKELSEDHLLILLHGAIPLNRVNIVYFRGETELKEFTVRPYVSRRDIKMSVSSDVFNSSNEISLDLLKVAVSESRPKSSSDIDVYQRASAFAGVALLLSNALEASQNLPLSVIHSWLRPLLYREEYDSLIRNSDNVAIVDYWLMYATLIIWMENSQTNLSGFEKVFYSEMTERQLSDTILLKLVLEKLLEYEDPHKFVPERFLNEIRPSLTARLKKTLPDRAEHLIDQYNLVFERMGQVLEGTISLDEFFAFLSADTEITNALLCFLMRHRPEDVLSWDNDLRTNDWGTLALAVLFSGLLYRRGRIPTRSDNQKRLFDFIDYLTANKVNRFLGSVYFADLEDELRYVNLSNRNSKLLYKDRQLFEKQLSDETERCLDILLEINFEDSNNENIGILLAQKMGWHHCITSVIRLDEREFALQYYTGRRELRIVGPVQVRVQLNTVEFIKQLRQTNRSTIKAHLDSEMQRALL